jgi:hypothetical protein
MSNDRNGNRHGGGGGNNNGGGGGNKDQRSKRRRNNRKQSPKPIDLWRPVPPLAPPEPITPAGDPTALVRSLGDPPLPGSGAGAEIAIAAVVDRAAGLATALAATGGLLAMDPPPDAPADED